MTRVANTDSSSPFSNGIQFRLEPVPRRIEGCSPSADYLPKAKDSPKSPKFVKLSRLRSLRCAEVPKSGCLPLSYNSGVALTGFGAAKGRAMLWARKVEMQETQRDRTRPPSDDGQYWPEVHHRNSKEVSRDVHNIQKMTLLNLSSKDRRIATDWRHP